MNGISFKSSNHSLLLLHPYCRGDPSSAFASPRLEVSMTILTPAWALKPRHIWKLEQFHVFFFYCEVSAIVPRGFQEGSKSWQWNKLKESLELFIIAEERLGGDREPCFNITWTHFGLCGGSYFRSEAILDAFKPEHVLRIDWKKLREKEGDRSELEFRTVTDTVCQTSVPFSVLVRLVALSTCFSFCFPMPFPQVTRLWAATSQCLWLFLHELGRSTRGRWAAIDVESKERKENIMFVADSVWHVFITAVYCVPEELVWSCWAPTWFWNRAVFLCWRSILGHLRGPESRLTCPKHISGKKNLRNLCATEWAPAMT